MTSPANDEAYFRTLVAQVDGHPEWSFDGTQVLLNDLAEQSATAVETGRTVEYRFDHVATIGMLHVEMPGTSQSQALRGTLHQALDRRERQNPETDEFFEELIASHAAVAERYENEYITPLSDSVSISRIEVPFDYDNHRLDEALGELGAASREIKQLHDDLLETLEDFR